jgi:hypothetical protein
VSDFLSFIFENGIWFDSVEWINDLFGGSLLLLGSWLGCWDLLDSLGLCLLILILGLDLCKVDLLLFGQGLFGSLFLGFFGLFGTLDLNFNLFGFFLLSKRFGFFLLFFFFLLLYFFFLFFHWSCYLGITCS